MADTLDQRDHWEVDREFTLPHFGDLVTDGRVEHDTDDVETAYFDTAERDLHAFGMTVTRRVGDDADWVLTMPGSSATLRFAGSMSVPEELATITHGVTGGRDLGHIATIRTLRDRYLVSDAEGGSRLEIDDDNLRASLGDRLLAWREVHAAPAPARLRERLSEAGARRATEPPRLNRLLAGDAERDTVAVAAGAQALDRYVAAQVDEIVRGDIELRRGHDPIHDTRVAIRRLRSTIRVFDELLDVFAEDDVADVEADLKWFAGVLGDVRDCQVQQDRLGVALDELPEELILGPVRARLRNDLKAVELPAREAVDEAMRSPRYAKMLSHLQVWRRRAPFHHWIEAAAVRRLANKAQRKARRRLATALEADDAELLHRARKAAKRARYAAELMEPIDPKAAKRERKHFKHIQSVLGDHQDTVVAMAWLRRIGVAAGTTDGENGFTFGLLYGREQALGAEYRRAVQKLE